MPRIRKTIRLPHHHAISNRITALGRMTGDGSTSAVASPVPPVTPP